MCRHGCLRWLWLLLAFRSAAADRMLPSRLLAPPRRRSRITADQVATSADVPSDPIALVVYNFLNAVRQGDTAAASGHLTPLALAADE